MLPSMPPVPVGPPPVSANYTDPDIKDKTQQITNSRQQGSNASNNPGVLLTTDSLDVPLEFMSGLTNQRAESSRPSLMPIFYTRYVVEGQTIEINSTNDYEALRASLSPEQRRRLEEDEKLPFEDRDPNLIAFDNFLRFAAMDRAISRQLGLAVTDTESALIAAENFLNQPAAVQRNLVEYANTIASYLEQHLQEIGPNDPSYDLWLSALRQLGRVGGLLEE